MNCIYKIYKVMEIVEKVKFFPKYFFFFITIINDVLNIFIILNFK